MVVDDGGADSIVRMAGAVLAALAALAAVAAGTDRFSRFVVARATQWAEEWRWKWREWLPVVPHGPDGAS